MRCVHALSISHFSVVRTIRIGHGVPFPADGVQLRPQPKPITTEARRPAHTEKPRNFLDRRACSSSPVCSWTIFSELSTLPKFSLDVTNCFNGSYFSSNGHCKNNSKPVLAVARPKLHHARECSGVQCLHPAGEPGAGRGLPGAWSCSPRACAGWAKEALNQNSQVGTPRRCQNVGDFHCVGVRHLHSTHTHRQGVT